MLSAAMWQGFRCDEPWRDWDLSLTITAWYWYSVDVMRCHITISWNLAVTVSVVSRNYCNELPQSPSRRPATRSLTPLVFRHVKLIS